MQWRGSGVAILARCGDKMTSLKDHFKQEDWSALEK
jgi:hypothetical protein